MTTFEKKAHCPNCCCGRCDTSRPCKAYFEKTLADDCETWVWQCGNCHAQRAIGASRLPRRTVERDGVKMTQAQSDGLDRILEASKQRAHHDGQYRSPDVKQWEVKPGYKMVSVFVETGAFDDENDMRSLWCRNRGLFFVGPRGGISASDAFVRKTTSKADLKRNPLIFGFGS